MPMKALAVAEEQIASRPRRRSGQRAKRIELIDATTRSRARDRSASSPSPQADKEVIEQRALAEIAEANAAEVRYAKDAEGQTAERVREHAQRRRTPQRDLREPHQVLPSIIRETVKPMEKIEVDQDPAGRRPARVSTARPRLAAAVPRTVELGAAAAAISATAS